MAFVFTVEDGTGLAGANAYIDTAYADDHHGGRGASAWAGATPEAKQAAIVKATDHIELLYGERFVGLKATAEQALAWPREEAWRDGELVEGVPDLVKRACAEYALRALSAPLAPDGRPVLMEYKMGGGLTKQVQYGRPGHLERWPAADRLLRPLLRPAEAVRA